MGQTKDEATKPRDPEGDFAAVFDAAKAGDNDTILRLGPRALGRVEALAEPERSSVEAATRVMLGRAHAGRSEFGTALTVLNEAIEPARRARSEVAHAEAVVWADIATVHRRQGRWAEAEEAYRHALRAAPDENDSWCGTLWFELARVQERQGKFGPACESYKEAIRRPLRAQEAAKSTGDQTAQPVYGAHDWLPDAVEGLVRCNASQTGNSDWVSFWWRSTWRKVGAIGLIAAMGLGWLLAFAKLLGLAIPIWIGDNRLSIPSETEPAWAFFVFSALPLALLLAHQLRSVGSAGVELAPDQPTFPPLPEDELTRVGIHLTRQ